MTQTNHLTTPSLNITIMGKRALIGAGIAYVLVTLFLFVPGVKENPNWPKFWMVRPLLMVPFAGAMGGVFYHLMDMLRLQKKWNKVVAVLVSLFVYLVGLWIGTVLGLDGTLWN